MMHSRNTPHRDTDRVTRSIDTRISSRPGDTPGEAEEKKGTHIEAILESENQCLRPTPSSLQGIGSSCRSAPDNHETGKLIATSRNATLPPVRLYYPANPPRRHAGATSYIEKARRCGRESCGPSRTGNAAENTSNRGRVDECDRRARKPMRPDERAGDLSCTEFLHHAAARLASTGCAVRLGREHPRLEISYDFHFCSAPITLPALPFPVLSRLAGSVRVLVVSPARDAPTALTKASFMPRPATGSHRGPPRVVHRPLGRSRQSR